MKFLISTAALLIAASSSVAASAETVASRDSFVRVGVTRLKLLDEGKVFINGTQDPQAGYTTPEKWIGNAEVGRFVLEKVAVQFSATTPASTSNDPAGSLAGLPNLGNDKFSIFTLTGTFHPLRGRVVSPYVGAGLALQHVWSTEDRLASNLVIHDAFGAVLQAGVELEVSDRVGLFFDVKKAFYDANASGDLGPAHITAVAQLDPLLLQTGALVRF